jgi:HK97 family phage prohead protease
MAYKSTSVQVKEFSPEEGIVVAYANVYSNTDLDGDISEPGSFIKTVDERFSKLKVYKNHDTNVELGVPLGKPDTKDTYGLLTNTQFNLEKEVSRDMLSDIKLKMKHKLDVDLSIGFKVIKRDEKDRRRIKEYSLWEYSFLTKWGANGLAAVLSAKDANWTEEQKIEKAIQFITDAYDLKYSDPKLIKLELLLKSLTEEPGNPLFENQPTDDQIKSLILNAFN